MIELNLWYTAGVMAVFMVLATLVFVLKFGWGDQFKSPEFGIVLSAVVFVFGLSLLGVWEIPIPGFVGSGGTAELAEREGPAGAFSKGILATVLATPCTGPFLVPAIAWAVRQPASINYVTFAMIGLGMASPFLVLGASPGLVHLLPRPGAWMETFKKLMGFVLMGTVVWIFSFLDHDYTVNTLALLLALAMGCWLIGRIPLTASWGQRLRAWAAGIGVVAAVTVVGFVGGKYVTPAVALIVGISLAGWIITAAPNKIWGGAGALFTALIAIVVAMFAFMASELPWEPFTRVALDEYRKQGQTVLVDFTADW